MKIKNIFLLLFITFQSYSQVSVGPKHIGKSGEFDKGVLEKFKKTETIFVFSNIYEKEIYEQILKDSWNVTPYKIVEFEDFKLEDYLSDKYSIADISGYIRIKEGKYGGTFSKLFTFFDIKMYDNVSILEQKDKLSSKKWINRKKDILDKNTLKIARFYLYQKDDFVKIAVPFKGTDETLFVKDRILDSPEYMDSVIEAMYSKDLFHNYKPGFLKNYLQKTNSLLKDEEVYWMYGSDYLPELKKLTKNKLYIPSYMNMTIDHNGWTGQDTEQNDENIHEIFKKYNYEYEIISDEDLSNRIMNNEELYYLRFVRMNTERFLQVVNSKSGEIIYREYITGLSYKIKEKNINELNKKIIAANKK